ncbi:hypothetical protein [Bradyrhizobium paxllaeri]|uniref:hypothetical protein n=1 Tax=Bradyrhizobium paxllaeri TaxID=190148 RepID=UPI0016522B43|nr:hypothetical protein [Bradyrhizobium paxllaeri]
MTCSYCRPHPATRRSERLLVANIQVVDGLRNAAIVGIGHHVPGIIHEVQVGAAEHIV